MHERKKFWLAPIIVIALFLGALIVFVGAGLYTSYYQIRRDFTREIDPVTAVYTAGGALLKPVLGGAMDAMSCGSVLSMTNST